MDYVENVLERKTRVARNNMLTYKSEFINRIISLIQKKRGEDK